MGMRVATELRPASETQKPRSAAASAVLVMIASGLSSVLGFGREVVSAHYYGTQADMDAFLNASTIPLILFGVFNGALVNALVPTFSGFMSSGQTDEVRKLGSTVLNALFLAMSALAVIGWVLAPYFVPIFAHGFPPSEQQLVVRMVRWLMPGIIATSLSGVCSALLNANHRFMASAYIWVASNLVTILFVIVFFRRLGIFALVLGSVIGLFAQLAVQIPSILRFKYYKFEMDLRHPGLAQALSLLVPVALGSGAAQINLAFDRYFASTLTSGSTAGLNYVTKLSFLPALIVSGAIGTVIFPLIARHFSASNNDGIKNSLSLALRMITFTVLPCAVGLSVLAYPIVQTLFERGAFGPAATALCASLVPFACLPLVVVSYNSILGRACYACKEVRYAVVGSFLTVGLNVLLSATWLPTLGAKGLLLANGASGALFSVYLATLLGRLIGTLNWKPVFISFVRISAASMIMGGALLLILPLHFVPGNGSVSRVLYLVSLLAFGGAVFLGAARLLGVEELLIASRTVMKRFSRRIVPAEAVSGFSD